MNSLTGISLTEKLFRKREKKLDLKKERHTNKMAQHEWQPVTEALLVIEHFLNLVCLFSLFYMCNYFFNLSPYYGH